MREKGERDSFGDLNWSTLGEVKTIPLFGSGFPYFFTWVTRATIEDVPGRYSLN